MDAFCTALKRSIHHRSGAVPPRTAVMIWDMSATPEEGT